SGFLRALRSALPSFPLQARDERAQRRRGRPALSRRRRHGQARVDLGKTLVTADVLAAPDDAIGERDARLAAHELADLEARALATDREPAAITLGREEHLIVATLDHFAEVGVELDHRTAALEPRRAEILGPVLRALHAMKHAASRRGTVRSHPWSLRLSGQ